MSPARIVTGSAGCALLLVGMTADLLTDGSPGFGARQLSLIGLGLLLVLVAVLPRRWVQNLLLIVGSAALALGAAEAVLRVFFPEDFTTPYRLHPRYLHALRPNVARRFHHLPVNGGRVVTFHVNADGFRGEPLQHRGGHKRIVVYGDSFVEAEFSELPDTFTEQLERRLRPRLPEGVEVINAGVTAYGPDQACRRIEDEVTPLDPDLVILAVFADNDFGDLVRNKIFRLGADGRLVDNAYRMGRELQETWEEADRGLYLGKLLVKARRAWLESDAAMRGTPTGRMKTWLYDSRMEYEQFAGGDDEVRRLLEDFYDADVSLTPGSASATSKLALMEAVLVRVRATLERHGRPLLLVVIPSPIDVVDGYDYGQVDLGAYPEYRRETLTDAVAAMAGRAGIPCLNLFGPFRAADPDALYLHGGDNHWNEAGQALAARLTAELILARLPWTGSSPAAAKPRRRSSRRKAAAAGRRARAVPPASPGSRRVGGRREGSRRTTRG